MPPRIRLRSFGVFPDPTTPFVSSESLGNLFLPGNCLGREGLGASLKRSGWERTEPCFLHEASSDSASPGFRSIPVPPKKFDGDCNHFWDGCAGLDGCLLSGCLAWRLVKTSLNSSKEREPSPLRSTLLTICLALFSSDIPGLL